MPQAVCYYQGEELGRKGLHCPKRQTMDNWVKHLRKTFNKELGARGMPWGVIDLWGVRNSEVTPSEIRLGCFNGVGFYVDRNANALATNS